MIFTGILADTGGWWEDIQFLGNELWRWMALTGVILASLVVGKTVAFLLDRQAARLEKSGQFELFVRFLRCLGGPLSMVALAVGLYLSGSFMFFVPTQAEAALEKKRLILTPFWQNSCKTVVALAVGWFIYRLVDIVEFFLIKWTSKTQTALDDQLVPLVRKALRVVVVIMLGLFIAQNIFNMNVGSLLAGLGLGGLAFALAAKDMLSNLFGSVTIFADRPFQLGDRIKVDGHDGMIEEVGFRSTRIRTLMGHQVIIPNSMISNTPVENVGRRPFLKRVLEVTVTYDTPPEKMQRAVDILNEMCEARKEHFAPDLPHRVFFTDFNSDNLAITVMYWFVPADWWEYCKLNHDFNMELLTRFNDEGIEFAFPTQTLYLRPEGNFQADIRRMEVGD